MARSKPLSNRQRKLQRKPAPGRAPSKPRLTVVSDRIDVGAELRAEETRRARAALALAAQDGEVLGDQGPVDPRADIAAGFGVQRPQLQGVEGRPFRVGSTDGFQALVESGALTADQAKAGAAYRLLFDAATRGLGSALGNVDGGGRASRDWTELKVGVDQDGRLVRSASALDLHRTYATARLAQLDRIIAATATGRELEAIRAVVGGRCSLREVAGGGGRAAVTIRDALSRALNTAAKLLRIAEH